MSKLTITLRKPNTVRDIKSIHVELREIKPGEGYTWQLFCKDRLGRERGTIYQYDSYDDARKAGMHMYRHLSSYK